MEGRLREGDLRGKGGKRKGEGEESEDVLGKKGGKEG